ncbi:MAG: ABC transporter ATP-binding protein [Ignisphaera sp.]
MGSIVIVRNIVKRFGKIVAVEGLSFDIGERSIYCLVGPNGAGKTTTLKIVVGLIKPDSGYVVVDGYDVIRNRIEALKRISFVPDYPDFPGHLTALEVLYLVSALRGFKKEDVEDQIKYYVDLLYFGEEIKKPVRILSRGGLQKLAIIASLIVKPKVVVMDEPLTNIDIDSQISFKKEIKLLASRNGISFLISSHMIPLIEGVCTDVGLINKGKMVFEGTMEQALNIAGEKASFEEFYAIIMGRKT